MYPDTPRARSERSRAPPLKPRIRGREVDPVTRIRAWNLRNTIRASISCERYPGRVWHVRAAWVVDEDRVVRVRERPLAGVERPIGEQEAVTARAASGGAEEERRVRNSGTVTGAEGGVVGSVGAANEVLEGKGNLNV